MKGLEINKEIDVIINHISIGTKDVVAAVAFYDAVFETLSIKRSHYIDGIAAAYGDSFEFWIGCPCENSPTNGNGSHVAFNAPNTEAVDNFYKVAIENGATCSGKPNLRPEYGEGYYAAYVLDLDGNKIEAVFNQF
nr:VOC family protein [Aliivibrio sp. S10_S31]